MFNKSRSDVLFVAKGIKSDFANTDISTRSFDFLNLTTQSPTKNPANAGFAWNFKAAGSLRN